MRCLGRTVKQRNRCAALNRVILSSEPICCRCPPLKKKSLPGRLPLRQIRRMQNCEFLDGDVY